MQASRQPALFVSHGGGPCFFMDDTRGPFRDMNKDSDTAQWFRDWFSAGGALKAYGKPSAILVISAHWEEDVPTIIDREDHELYYDYYGFPDATYELEWPAKGSPPLVSRVEELLETHELPLKKEKKRGLDHGVFIPLKLALPDADVPVTQLSLLSSLSAEEHVRLGLALRPLRDEGVLIIGSGQATHDLRGMDLAARPGDAAGPYAAFVEWLDATLINPEVSDEDRLAAIVEWEKRAPGARCVRLTRTQAWNPNPNPSPNPNPNPKGRAPPRGAPSAAVRDRRRRGRPEGGRARRRVSG
mmetsp:Transcript_41159/g.129020  ORF Transcript_41159/g.129020 Transcript_41159/m.129020 type:complete len:300 (-) Transcript_41159:311-1210(-)